jgi:tRNA U55 pseudouridine synthase TruB
MPLRLALEGPEASFTIDISSGGYVRSVAHELGQDLGCGAHLSRLRRTRAGMFTLDDAHTLEELEALAGNIRRSLKAEACASPRLLLPEMPSVTGDNVALGRLAQRRAGQLAGVFRRAAGEGFRQAARVGRDRQARGRNAVSTGAGDGVKGRFQGSGFSPSRCLRWAHPVPADDNAETSDTCCPLFS